MTTGSAGYAYRYARTVVVVTQPCSDARYQQVATRLQPFDFQEFYLEVKKYFSQQHAAAQNHFFSIFRERAMRQHCAEKVFFVNVVMVAIKRCIDQNNSQASMNELQKQLKNGAHTFRDTDIARIYERAYFSLRKPDANFFWSPIDDGGHPVVDAVVSNNMQGSVVGQLALGYQG